MKRGLLIAAPVILVTLVAALLLAPGFIDWNQYREQAQEQIRVATGHRADLRGDVSLTILPAPHLSIADVTVAAPEGSASDYLAKLERMDIYLSVLPLLTGKIDVSSVTMVSPDIALEVFSDGRKNWMTPELESAISGEKSQKSSTSSAISFQNVSIKKGKFSYRDRSQGKDSPISLQDINMTARAETMRGPFELDGSAALNGNTIEIKTTTGQIDESQSLAIRTEGSVKPAGIDFEYSGVVSTTEPFQAQGETSLKIVSLKDALGRDDLGLDEDSMQLEGLLTATNEKVEFKGASFALGKNKFTGDIKAALSPLAINGAFAAQDTVNLDAFLGNGAQQKTPATGILPETLTMPAAFDAAIQLTAPAAIYRGAMYKKVNLNVSKKDNVFAAEFVAADIPGKGKADIKAALKFAAKSASKSGAMVYSEPEMAIALDADTQNMPQTIEAASGIKNIAFLNMWKSGAVHGNAAVSAKVLTLKDTSVTLGNSRYTIGGSYAAGGARPKLVADIAADSIDFDAIQQNLSKGNESKASLEDSLKALALPFDLAFDFGAQKAKFQGRDIKGLLAKGTLNGSSLAIENLSAQEFAGAAFKASGGIASLKDLTGIDVKVSGQAGDAKELATMAGFDASALPKSLESANVEVAAKGTLKDMDVSAVAKVLNGNLAVAGKVKDPLGKATLSDMALKITHRNLAEALQALSPDAPRYVSLEKPLNFAANISREGTLYTLKDMQAEIAGSPVTGGISVDVGGTKPSLRGDLAFKALVIQTAAAASGKTAGAHWSQETMDTGWMNVLNADIDITADSLLYQAWDLQKPVISIVLQDGKLNLNQFDANLFGGQMAMKAALQAGQGNKGFAAVSGNAKFTSVQAEGLVKALVGTKLVKATGDVSMDGEIETSGSSQSALVSALKGSGNVSGRDIVLEGIDLVRLSAALSDQNKPADTLQGLFQGVASGGSTAFKTLTGNYAISQGIVNIAKLDLDGDRALLATTGSINIPNWTLATAHTITLKETPEVPPFTMKFAGSLSNPAQTFGQGAINDYLSRKINKKIENLISEQLLGKQQKPGKKTSAGQDVLQNLLGGNAAPAPSPQPVATEQAPLAAPVQDTTPAATPEATEPANGDAAPVQGATPEAAPAAQTPPAEKTEDEKAQEAIQGVLKGLLGN